MVFSLPDRSVTYVFKGNFTSLTAGLAAAGKGTAELGTKLTALDKNGRQMRSGLTSLGGAAGKFGLVAAAGFTVAIAAAANFDKSMSAVQAATHETADNMELLRKAAIKAGADTAYSATEAAGAIEELAKAGVSTQDILDGGLSGALNLAAAGAIDVADAAELAATAMTQFKLGGDQVNHVADLLAAGAGKAQGGVGDLGMALKQSGLVAAQTGLSIEDTTGALAEFAANGLIGSDAGTSFKTMLQALNPSSVKAADLMAKLGLNAYDAQGNFVGLENYAGQLQESLGQLSVEQQNAALKTIFGSDAVRAAAIIFKDGAQGVAEWRGKVDDAGYAADTAGTRMDNLSGDLEQLKGSLETALIGAGDGSQGPLRKLTQGATDAVNAFNKLPSGAQSATTALLGVTAVTGGSLWFGSKVINAVAETKDALSQLGLTSDRTSGSLGRMTRTAGGITTLAAAVGILGNSLASATGAKIDTSDLSRDLEALANGTSTEVLDKVVDSLGRLQDTSFKLSEPLHEAGTAFGLFGGTPLDNAADNVDQVDQALASLVESGNADEAAKIFAKIQSSITGLPEGSSFTPFGQSAKDFDAYATALKNVGHSTDVAAGATEDYGTKQSAAQVQVDKLNESIKKQRDVAHDTASQFFNLGDSLDDTKVSLSEWIKDLRKQAQALRDFRVNAETAAKKGLREGLIKALEEAGPAGALRLKQLADASKSEIGRANQAWSSGQREIAKYTDAIGGVPKSVSTTVHTNTSQAVGAIANVRSALDQLHNKTITINTIRQGVGLAHAADAMDAHGSADGGTIPKTGMGYADRHPYLLADGEEVISNRRGQADRYRPLLKAINRAADGDTVGGRAGFTTAGSFVTPATLHGATAAIVELRSSIRSLNLDIRESDKTIKQETAERERLTKTVSRNQAEVDRVTGLYDSLSSAIQSNLAANQFEKGDPWKSGGGIAGILASLSTSTANANAMTKATGTLSASLTGAALQSVLEQGLNTTQMFAGLSPAELKKYQAAFDVNAVAIGRAGAAGGNAVYGRAQEKANQILAASQAELARQTHELQIATQARDRAERQRDLQTKWLGKVKDELSDIKTELRKNRGAAESGQRSKQ